MDGTDNRAHRVDAASAGFGIMIRAGQGQPAGKIELGRLEGVFHHLAPERPFLQCFISQTGMFGNRLKLVFKYLDAGVGGVEGVGYAALAAIPALAVREYFLHVIGSAGHGDIERNILVSQRLEQLIHIRLAQSQYVAAFEVS